MAIDMPPLLWPRTCMLLSLNIKPKATVAICHICAEKVARQRISAHFSMLLQLFRAFNDFGEFRIELAFVILSDAAIGRTRFIVATKQMLPKAIQTKYRET